MTAHIVTLGAFTRKHGQYTIRVLIHEGDRVEVTDAQGNRVKQLPRDVAYEAIALSTEVAAWRRGKTVTREAVAPYLDEIMRARGTR